MSLRAILSDPTSLKMALLSIAAIVVVVIYLAYRLRGEGPKVKVKSTPGPILLHLDKVTTTEETIATLAPESTAREPQDQEHAQQLVAPVMPTPEPVLLTQDNVTQAKEEAHAPVSEHTIPDLTPHPVPSTPTFATIAQRTGFFSDIMRGALVVLALVVAAGFVLIILPQQSVDRIAQSLQSRSSAAPLQEEIAFLYLGDELKDNEFDIRGAVRNIMTEPIEKLDAVIRLYAAGGDLLETVVVRMDKETIGPDEVAQFHLAYPDYKGQFGSYAVEFKLRQGENVLYKDMRAPRGHN